MKKIYLSLLIVLCLFIPELKAQNWQALTCGDASSEVFAIAVDPNGTIYAGGSFPGKFKKWNGSAWVSPVTGKDPNGNVYAILAKTASDISIGGDFTQIGSVPIRYFAKLIPSTSSYSRIGNGFNNAVRCIYSNSNESTIYVGGFFTADSTGTTTLNHIAVISGTSVFAVGSGVNDNVYAIHRYSADNNGVFQTYVGTDNLSNPVWKYESSAWSSLSGISGGTVYALTSFNNYLYAGGDFQTPFYALGKWNRSGWTNTITNFNATTIIKSLAVNSITTSATQRLFVGGQFTNIGTAAVNYVGYMKDYLSPLQKVASTELNGKVNSISVKLNGASAPNVYVGGKFSTPGFNAAYITSTVGIDDINENLVSSSLFPNPMTDRASIQLETKTPLSDPVLEIYDLQSRLVNGINSSAIIEGNKTQFIIDRSGLTSGTYFYMVKDKDAIVASNRFIVN